MNPTKPALKTLSTQLYWNGYAKNQTLTTFKSLPTLSEMKPKLNQCVHPHERRKRIQSWVGISNFPDITKKKLVLN